MFKWWSNSAPSARLELNVNVDGVAEIPLASVWLGVMVAPITSPTSFFLGSPLICAFAWGINIADVNRMATTALLFIINLLWPLNAKRLPALQTAWCGHA